MKTAAANPNAERVLHRSDVRTFDDQAWKLIRTMQHHGWRGRVSSRGHAIMRAPDGETTASVSRKHSSHGNNAANAWAEFRRWLDRQETAMATIEATPEVEVAQKLKCSHRGCDFTTTGMNAAARMGAHVANLHSGPHICGTCGKAYATASGLGGHRNTHRGEPRIDGFDQRARELYAWLSTQDRPVTTLDVARVMFAAEGFDESDQVATLRQRRIALRALARLRGMGRAREVVKGVPGRSGEWVAVEPSSSPTVVEEPEPEPVGKTSEPEREPATVITLPPPSRADDVEDATDTLAAIRSLVAPELVEEVSVLRLVLAEAEAARDEAMRELEEHRTRIALMRETLGL